MKIRNGFISNSSSSSFIIAYKKEINEIDFVKNVLLIPENSPMFNFGKEVFKLFMNNSREIKNIDEWIKENFYDEKDYETKEMKKIKDEGFIIKDGSFSNEEYGLEDYLCNTDLNIKTENFIIIHSGGY